MSSIKELRNLIRKELDLYVENNMQEGSCSACAVDNPCPAHGGEAKMHRTTLAHLVADAQVLLKLVEDEDDLPEWLKTKITKAGDYMSSAARYITGNAAREMGSLEEGTEEYYHIADGTYDDGSIVEEDMEFWDDIISEAEYRGRKVKLNKPMRGDVKKFKVYVKDPKTGNVKKVNFGDKKMRIKKSNPKRRKSFRARHNCDNPGPKTKARYWSCRKW